MGRDQSPFAAAVAAPLAQFAREFNFWRDFDRRCWSAPATAKLKAASERSRTVPNPGG